MSGGSSGGGMPFQQDSSTQIEQMRQQQAKEERDRAEAKANEDTGAFRLKREQAFNTARTSGQNYLASRGLDPAKYSGMVNQATDDAVMKVPNLDPNPAQYFTSDIFDTAFTNAQNKARVGANANVKNAFSAGFDKKYISDDMDDATINQIIEEQFGSAQKQIDYNRQRGTINDQGYAEAQRKLGASKAAGSAQLGDIGSAVLSKGRDQLTGIANEAGNAASNYTLGNTDFDVTPYTNRLKSTRDAFVNTIPGSVRNAVGSTNYFDIPSILTAAGIAQGPQNLTTVDSQSAGAPGVQKKLNNDRGLGSTGSF